MPLKLSDLKTHDQVLAEHLEDPEFRAEWERTALARAIARAIVMYRADHRLAQSQLAKRLGVSQPWVGRLEMGEHNPKVETLHLLADKLGIEIALGFGSGKTKTH